MREVYVAMQQSFECRERERGHFGKGLHEDGNAVRELNWIKLNLFPGKKEEDLRC